MSKIVRTISPKSTYKVRTIKLRVIAKDIYGSMTITDIMLQGGTSYTNWIGHPSEIRWSFDNG